MYLRHATLIAGVCVTALAAGCGSDDSSEQATVQTPPASSEASPSVPLPGTAGEGFQLPGAIGEDNAFTYDEAAVPVGSAVTVDSEKENGSTTVTFNATGLAPNRDFGVHVHTRRCGPAPADSGPQNEIWLDVTTDQNGAAQASTTVGWEFRADEAKSVVLHAQRTMTGPGQAGMAGDRLACIDEDF